MQCVTGATDQQCTTRNYSIVSVNSRAGCVTNCRVKNNNKQLRLPKSPAKPVFTSLCLYMLLFIEIYLTKQKSPHVTEKSYFQCTISQTNNYCSHCKFLRAEGRVTTYCRYIVLDRIGNVAKYSQTWAANWQQRPTYTNGCHSYKCLLGSTCMIVTSWETPVFLQTRHRWHLRPIMPYRPHVA